MASYTPASERLSQYNSRATMARRAERDMAAAIVPALAARSYHIPGNSWWQDWMQYFANNHPVLGLCCSHKLHPVSTCKRIITLIGSIACGLALSNLIYLSFLASAQGVNSEFAAVDFHFNVSVANTTVGMSQVVFTNYQVTLWTFGTTLHTMFDLTIWQIAACGCCLPGGKLECLESFRWMGSYVVIIAVTMTAAIASFIVVLRATLDAHPEVNPDSLSSGGLFDDTIELGNTSSPSAYRFLISWCVEMVLALFLFYFVIGTILFSGVLGCGKLPFLGGRPREVMLEERALQRKNSKLSKNNSKRISGSGRGDEEMGKIKSIYIQ